MSTHRLVPECLAGAELTLPEATGTRERLLDTLQRSSDVYLLDLSGIERIDGAGVQLLLALALEATTSGRRLEIVAASPALDEALDLLGLTGLGGPFGTAVNSGGHGA